jgi:phosphoribosylformylglycinamidine cyclo-ligase
MDYRDAGVDIEAGDGLVPAYRRIAERTRIPGVLGSLGGFASLFSVKDLGMEDPLLVSGTDGVGTKLLLAIELGRHDTVGIDLVAMSVNDIATCGAKPLFFLDYFACGKLEPGIAEAVVAGIGEGCLRAGCALVGGETAELPGMYPPGEYDLAGFALGAVERSRLVDGRAIRAGDTVLGVAASGFHSNGYSLVRHIVKMKQLDLAADYGLGRPLGEALLEPTVLYPKAIAAAMAAGEVRGIAHITGGGIPGNACRILPKGLDLAIRKDGWPVPPLFTLFAREGGVAEAEMFRTFNMGLGLVVVCAPADAAACRQAFAAAGSASWEIGHVTAGSGEVVLS